MRISDWSSDVCSSDLHAARTADRAGELAQRLRHQPRLQADVAVAHLALDFGARDERSVRVDDEHVDRDRKRVGAGTSVSVRVDSGGRTIIKKKVRTLRQ